VGLVLATPLTVCLVVMGRHIPKLAFLSILLSDEEALTPAEDCYQRLLRAGEHDEMELVDNYLKSNPLVTLFDSVLIPVVTAAGTDHRSGFLETEQMEFVQQGLSDILDAISPVPPSSDEADFRICSVPARAYRDQLAGEMLVQLLDLQGTYARNAAAKMKLEELIPWLREARADLVCISVVPPTTLLHARYLCSKLRTSFPKLKIIVGLWGRSELPSETVATLKSSGADEIVTSMAGATEWVASHRINPEPPLEEPFPDERLPA
jgi:hypothetical protein